MKSFSETMKEMYNHVDSRSELKAPFTADGVYEIIMKGLKTGMYHLRSRPAADAVKFAVDSTMLKPAVEADELETTMAQMIFSLENRDGCLSCGG